MPQLTPKFGYYVITAGILLQIIGLIGGSWGHDSATANGGVLSFDRPGDVLLVIGMAVTVLGAVAGMASLGPSLSFGDGAPRLLPLLPLVLLVTISLGGASFAYQMNSSNATTSSVAGAQQPQTASDATATTATDCPPGSFWHEPTQRCLSLAVDENGAAAVVTPVSPGATPVCPGGTSWHPLMKHCMQTSLLTQPCPSGFAWDAQLVYCAPVVPVATGPGPAPTPACPDGTFWHPVMNHCMSTVCPIGYSWSWDYLTCVQGAPSPTPVPTDTPTPIPGATATPTPAITSTPTAVPTPACPDGYFWHPVMGHCMSNTCPPGLVFNYETLYCELPSTPGSPTATPTPTIAVTATPTATPTGVPAPVCPDGYFWHPAMGHCMSNTCPPGLIFNYETLYCELLPPTPAFP